MDEKEIRVQMAGIARAMGREDVAASLMQMYNLPNVPLGIVLAFLAVVNKE